MARTGKRAGQGTRRAAETRREGPVGPLAAHPFACALAVNAALFLFVYLVWTPGFQFNDDPMMMLVAAGVGRGVESSPYLSYTHVAVGWVLQQLYALERGVPWYALYLIAGLLAAHTALLGLILRRNPRLPALGLYLAYFVLVGVGLLLELQFTISATLLCVAGFALVLTDDEGGRVSWTSFVGVLLIVAGSLVRDEALLLSAALAAPLGLTRLRSASPRSWGAPAALAGLAVAACFALVAIDESIRSGDPDASGWQQLNPVATPFVDDRAHQRVPLETLERILGERGWTIDDLVMFLSWFYLDDERFGAESLADVLSALPTWNVQLTAADVLRELAVVGSDPFVWNALGMLAIALLFVALDRRGSEALAAAALLIPALFVVLILREKPPPDRLYFPVFAYLSLLPLILASDGLRTPAGFGRARILIGGPLLILAMARGAWMLADYQRESARGQVLSDYQERSIEDLSATRERLYLAWTGAPSWEFMSPFGRLEHLEGFVAPDSRPEVSTLATLRHFGIDDAHRALFERDDVFLVVHTKYVEKRLPLLGRYLNRHYGVEVVFDRVADNALFEVYSLSTR